jgi:heavy metal translocating P-type ATPase
MSDAPERGLLRSIRDRVPLAIAPLSLAAGLALRWSGQPKAGTAVLTAGLALAGLPIVWRTVKGLVRGRFAADVVAALSIIGSLAFSYPVAGLVIVLMQSGGEALERFAAGRASAAVNALEALAPRTAHRLTPAGVEDVAAGDVHPGDMLLVRPGELVPCDAVVVDGTSHLDTASLTGEPVPARVLPGAHIFSGSVNQESPLTVRAIAAASQSQYERIVELVRSAQSSRAPLQRVADRYAIWFTPATLLLCLGTWLVTGDPARVLAVLVVATPCPLLLATPVAIIGGINRAARQGIIIRNGGALEQLGTVDHVVCDKTGTLTIGRPVVSDVRVAAGTSSRDALQCAAALEQASSHLLARSVVEAAGSAPLQTPSGVVEDPGRGVRGIVGGVDVVVGSRSYVVEHAPAAASGLAALNGHPVGLRAYVAFDGEAGAIVSFADRPRDDLAESMDRLRDLGLTRFTLLSGDHQANVHEVASAAGIDDARGDLLAEDKVTVVRELVRSGRRVLMIGDGTNDAPALAAATVGVALAAHGRGISAESADVILLKDDLHLLPASIALSRRTLRIARQSIWAGLGLSVVGMAAAAAGYLQPTAGAILQEVVDLAVILNALRAAR